MIIYECIQANTSRKQIYATGAWHQAWSNYSREIKFSFSLLFFLPDLKIFLFDLMRRRAHSMTHSHSFDGSLSLWLTNSLARSLYDSLSMTLSL